MKENGDLASTSAERARLLRGGNLHWFHWLALTGSLVLTLSAWYFTKQQIDEKNHARFSREADRAIELVVERLQKYEDALWSGVGALQASGGDVTHAQWVAFAETLRIERKYPGIGGIGVIHHVERTDFDAYVARQRVTRPDYTPYPPHDGDELLPITYIEPASANYKAVGLDMAHETNRYTAARQARDAGVAQITGPIVLVQDQERSPGFLFYAPFYAGGTHDSVEKRRESFGGMVYAPFVVKKLMEGTLARESRLVGIRIDDAGEVLYDEHVDSEPDYDPNPLYSKHIEVVLYGRTWSFDIASARSFHTAASSNQPLVILAGGLLIDALLFTLFVALTRSNRRAVAFADATVAEVKVAQDELVARSRELERSNADLEQFAHVSSHDLQEPIRMVASYTDLLQAKYGPLLDETGTQYMRYVNDGAKRMHEIVDALLKYSRVNADKEDYVALDATEALQAALQNLAMSIEKRGAEVQHDELPQVVGNRAQLTQVFQNLVGNGIKFSDVSDPRVRVFAKRSEAGPWVFGVQDNGIGIRNEHLERIFTIFKRLHHRDQYPGTGIGLSITKKIIERHGGHIWIDSEPGTGSTVYFTLPGAEQAEA